jgi:hypothetical protein
MSKTGFNHVFGEWKSAGINVLSSGEPILKGNSHVLVLIQNKGGILKKNILSLYWTVYELSEGYGFLVIISHCTVMFRGWLGK